MFWSLLILNMVKRKAKNTNKRDYIPIDLIDMKKFFACLYLLGINNVSDMRDAWSNQMHAILYIQLKRNPKLIFRLCISSLSDIASN